MFNFMISNGEGWHYLVLKKILLLLREVTSKYNGDFYLYLFILHYCLNSFGTKTKLEPYVI